MTDFKPLLLPLLPSTSALTFGQYTLKSGRISPYFFNSSLLYTASLHYVVCSAYAEVLAEKPFSEINRQKDRLGSAMVPKYDILFGPAYKGIPLAASILPLIFQQTSSEDQIQNILDSDPNPFANIGYAYNRKEAKTHGEGGNLVGASVQGKRVVIVDDVITAGTAVREAVDLIRNQGGTVVGVVVLLDRQERVSDEEPRSALQVASEQLGVPVRAVLQFSDFISAIEQGTMPGAGTNELRKMKEYRERYQSLG